MKPLPLNVPSFALMREDGIYTADENDYLIACWDDKRPIVKVGIAFDHTKHTIRNRKKENV